MSQERSQKLILADDVERAGWLAIYAAQADDVLPGLEADRAIMACRERCGPSEADRLHAAIVEAIKASDNDGGSASDAIQDGIVIGARLHPSDLAPAPRAQARVAVVSTVIGRPYALASGALETPAVGRLPQGWNVAPSVHFVDESVDGHAMATAERSRYSSRDP